MFEFRVTGNTVDEIKSSLQNLLGLFGKKEEVLVEATPPLVEVPKGPVIPMEELQKNVETAPVHEEPAQPTIEEVRAALKALRDRKGSGAVKELLKAFGADNLMELKPEDYLGALARANTEV